MCAIKKPHDPPWASWNPISSSVFKRPPHIDLIEHLKSMNTFSHIGLTNIPRAGCTSTVPAPTSSSSLSFIRSRERAMHRASNLFTNASKNRFARLKRLLASFLPAKLPRSIAIESEEAEEAAPRQGGFHRRLCVARLLRDPARTRLPAPLFERWQQTFSRTEKSLCNY